MSKMTFEELLRDVQKYIDEHYEEEENSNE